MPLVRMLTSGAGPQRSWEAGDEVAMTVDEAAVWADGVRGELVRGQPLETPEANRRRHGGRVETPEGHVRGR